MAEKPFFIGNISGDGGTRTRVRKIRPANVYERRLSLFLTPGQGECQTCQAPVAQARKPSFARGATTRTALWLCHAWLHHRSEGGVGRRRLTRRRLR